MMKQRPLTIALLIATPGTSWGGMERHTADLALVLADRGHSVHVLGHREYRSRFPGPVHFHAQPVQLGRKNPWLRWSIRKCLRQIQPDIVHAQGNKAAHLVSRLKGRIDASFFGTVHGEKSSHRPFKHLDAVIAVSQPIFDALVHPKKRLILNGIPVKAPTSSTSSPLNEQHTNIVAAGRLEPVKGFHLLLEAWSKIQSAEHKSAHLTIFGEGSERRRLEERVDTLELAETVTLAGHHPDMSSVFRTADLTVISSEREGLPYILIESLQADCPVVSTPVPAIASILPEQAMAKDHTADSLARTLASALADLNALRSIEKTAMAFARTQLTLTSMANQTEAFYRDVLNQPSDSPE